MTVIMQSSISLDGFSAGPRISRDRPLGEGGERLHTWMPDEPELTAALSAESGATIIGRRMYDVGAGLWKDVPFPGRCFVLTHEVRADRRMPSGSFTFVGDGPRSALDQARAAAGDRPVVVLGGAEVCRQFLRAGLIDEIRLQLVPVLFGAGTRLFDDLEPRRVELRPLDTITSRNGDVVHLRYRVVRGTS
ncbi:dihydrofolate reductase family protein [Streptosporangium sp. NPDC050855]|uniref:dihydrofolate reductase family protein n=1 Tax=Streptosporangium sp. NPDC050855 TaxID=3366194 RepID=UPI00378FDC0F